MFKQLKSKVLSLSDKQKRIVGARKFLKQV